MLLKLILRIVVISTRDISNSLISRGKGPIDFTGIMLLSSGSSSFIRNAVDGRRKVFDVSRADNGGVLEVSYLNFVPVAGTCTRFPMAVIVRRSIGLLKRIIMGKGHPSCGLATRKLRARIRKAMLDGVNATRSILGRVPKLRGGGSTCRMFKGKDPVVCIGKELLHSLSRLSRLGSRSVGGMRLVADPNTECSTSIGTMVEGVKLSLLPVR